MYHFLPGGEFRPRVELPGVVSKYIGETEKNLAALVDQDRSLCWVLFFDEGNDSYDNAHDGSDTCDRYVNLKVTHPLQRMENSAGLVIVATKLQVNMDKAFPRRIDVAIRFPKPDESGCLGVWRVASPTTPFLRLSRFGQ